MFLVTGANGQLGFDVMRELQKRGVACHGTDVDTLDITDKDAVFAYFERVKPTKVMHCAAYTAVDKAEDDVETCTKVNVDGTRHIAMYCKEAGIPMMYISTDYVFEGTGDTPYDVTDTPNPQNVYGKTKYEGEQIVQALLSAFFIVRVTWTYGAHGNNFVKTMLRLAETMDEVRVVEDQVGSPSSTSDVARVLCDLILTEHYGIYHAANAGFCSWAQFAEAIFVAFGKSTKVVPIPSSEYPTKTKRPHNSRLDTACLLRAGVAPLPSWQVAILTFVDGLA